jgi:hypothetical protein
MTYCTFSAHKERKTKDLAIRLHSFFNVRKKQWIPNTFLTERNHIDSSSYGSLLVGVWLATFSEVFLQGATIPSLRRKVEVLFPSST